MKTVDHQKFLSSLSNETRASLAIRTDRHGGDTPRRSLGSNYFVWTCYLLLFARMAAAIGTTRDFDSFSFYTFT